MQLRATVMVCVAVGCGLSWGAWAVTVDFYSSRGPAGSATGLNLAHALIADGADGDRNGPSDLFRPADAPVYVGDGIPDGVQMSVLEHLYATPSAPYHGLAVDAFAQNRQGLVAWNNGVCSYPAGDGPGSTLENPVYGPLFAYADFPYCDLFGGGINVPVCFPRCSPDSALILELAAYITVSEYILHANSKWHLLNYGTPTEALIVDFDSDPSFNREAASVLGIHGDLDGDGLSNLAEYLSVARAVIAETPGLAGATPATLWGLLTRTGKDTFIGRYIDVAVYVAGPDPGDPTPPAFGIDRQSSSRWLEAGPERSTTLEVTTIHGVPPVAFQWHKDGAPLSDGAGVTGATASHLHLGPPIDAGTAGVYRCVATDAIGHSASSQPIELAVFEAGSLPGLSGVGLALLGAALTIAAVRRRR